LYRIVSYWYCIILYYIVLYCIILYCFVLYYLFVFFFQMVCQKVCQNNVSGRGSLMCQGGDRSKTVLFFKLSLFLEEHPHSSTLAAVRFSMIFCFIFAVFLYFTLQYLGLQQMCFNTLYSSILKSMVNNPNWCKLCRFIHVATFKYVEYVEGGPDHKAPEVVWNTSSIRTFKRMFR